MPRYFLHLTDGKRTVSEHQPEAVEFSGDAAAIEQGEQLARSIKAGELMQGRDWDGWFVKIVDEHGREVETLAIADAP
jgi:hypothetical protein